MTNPARGRASHATWGLLCLLAPTAVAAQSVRDVVAASRLGAGYAQLINLGATSDISSSNLDVSDGDSRSSIDILRLPYSAAFWSLTPDTDLYWRVSGNYLRMKDSTDTSLLGNGPGSITSRWSAYSVTGGLSARRRLGNGFTVEPAFDAGVARLLNDANYSGGAAVLQPLLDGVLVNWHTNAWMATPSVGLGWSRTFAQTRTVNIRAHVAWTWVNSFGESDPVLRFRETAGTYSVRAEYVAPLGMAVAGRALNYVTEAGYGGLFGGSRDALGFTTIAEVGLGVEVPVRETPQSTRVSVGASYLFGPDVRGWSFKLALVY